MQLELKIDLKENEFVKILQKFEQCLVELRIVKGLLEIGHN